VTGGGQRHSSQTRNPAYLYSLVDPSTEFNKDIFKVLVLVLETEWWGMSCAEKVLVQL